MPVSITKSSFNIAALTPTDNAGKLSAISGVGVLLSGV